MTADRMKMATDSYNQISRFSSSVLQNASLFVKIFTQHTHIYCNCNFYIINKIITHLCSVLIKKRPNGLTTKILELSTFTLKFAIIKYEKLPSRLVCFMKQVKQLPIYLISHLLGARSCQR